MNRAMRSFLFAIGLLVIAAMALCSPRTELPTPGVGTAPPAAVEAPSVAAPRAETPRIDAPQTQASPRQSGKGFRTPSHLADHFEKHGAEFRAANAATYLALAQTLRDAPAGGDILEIVRPTDGVISRFDRRSRAFLAVDRDGTIRTFFKPNDGEAYFRRQANRLPQNDGARP